MKRQLSAIINLFFLMNISIFSAESKVDLERWIECCKELKNKTRIEINILHKYSIDGLWVLDPMEAIKYNDKKKYEGIPLSKTILISEEESEDLVEELVKLLPDKGRKGLDYLPAATIIINTNITLTFSPQSKQVYVLNIKDQSFEYFEISESLDKMLTNLLKKYSVTADKKLVSLINESFKINADKNESIIYTTILLKDSKIVWSHNFIFQIKGEKCIYINKIINKELELKFDDAKTFLSLFNSIEVGTENVVLPANKNIDFEAEETLNAVIINTKNKTQILVFNGDDMSMHIKKIYKLACKLHVK